MIKIKKEELKDKSILIVCAYISLGGIGKILKFVANNFCNYFGKVTVISTRGEVRPIDLSPEVDYISLSYDINSFVLKWRTKEIIELHKLFKKINANVILSFGTEMSVISMMSHYGVPSKMVSAERYDPYILSSLWKCLSRWAYNNSDYCIFQLEKARDFFCEKVKNKSFVIPNAYVPDNIAKNILSERKKTIVSVGRFEWAKGFDILISAFSIVEKRHPDYKLIIYGDGECLSEYKTLVKQLRIEEKVSFPGYIKKSTDYIQGNGIFVLSSRHEGIPNVLIEAMSTGIPTISTDCSPGGGDFLTNHGERGMLVEAENPQQLAEGINFLIENETEALSFGQRGREIVEILNPTVIISKWFDAFDIILS